MAHDNIIREPPRGSDGPPLQANVNEDMSDVSELDDSDERENAMIDHKGKFTGSFIVGCFLASMCLAYVSGRIARMLWIDGPQREIIAEYTRRAIVRDRRIGANPYYKPPPLLVAKDGESVPHTHYSTKIFDTARSVSTSSWLMTSEDADRLAGDGKLYRPFNQDDDVQDEESGDEDEEEEEENPTIQHLMVDIKNVDRDFLDSEQRLVHAMLVLFEEADLKILSYHCHGFTPAGVSCVGILLSNHIAFHTWPIEGVITFDLCTSKSTSILPLVSSIERLFRVPRIPSTIGEDMDGPVIRWAYTLRGFDRDSSEVSNLFLWTDLGQILLDFGPELKSEVVSVGTNFQHIHIYDIIDSTKQGMSRYKKSLSSEGSYESRHPFLFRPDRTLFLDGWIQSSLHYEAAYHEALVQPALFAHENPKRVAIIGGGEGATLREVLKHDTVAEAVMVEIDEELVNVSRDSIPEWSDCSDLQGSYSWCIKDPRATVYYEDALEWFMSRYSPDERQEAVFDVIILDALDPESEIPFAKALYSNNKFMQAFFDALSDDGILVMQLGEAPYFGSPDETFSRFKNRLATTRLLEDIGFQSIHAYEESHCGFDAPWSYVIGFKSYATRARWYRNAAEINLDIHERTVKTKSGASPFYYFDGPTMVSYQVPHRNVESVFCRRQPTPKECECINDVTCLNIPQRSFDVVSGENKDASTYSKGTVRFNPVEARHFGRRVEQSFFGINTLRDQVTSAA